MQRHKEERVYSQMRRNVKKSVSLRFKHYELRVKAIVEANGQEPYDSILPIIKMKFLKRMFIRDEILYELRQYKGLTSADLTIEVFAVYGTETYIGEYKRYLGELFFFMSNIDKHDQTTYRYKTGVPYFQDPNKSNFIPERI